MNAQLAGGRPEGESLELGLLHILPQSPLASSGHLPFGSSLVAVGRQRLGDGARSVPRITSAQRKTGCANRDIVVWTSDGSANFSPGWGESNP